MPRPLPGASLPLMRRARAALRGLVGPGGLALCLVMAAAGEARAEGKKAPPARGHVYSKYEQGAIEEGVERLGGSIDPDPEGKTIETVEVVTLDVIEKRDPAPLELNSAHVTSRTYVIEREVLLRPGDVWRQVLVDETARNLRALPQLSLVVCLPLRSTQPGKVRLAVITKDVWSLRLVWDLAYTPGGLEKLVVAPTEINLLGLHHTVGTRAELSPASLSLGARYAVPRLFGSRVSAQVEGNVIFNRDEREPEGSYGSVNLARPLYSSQVDWSWAADFGWRTEVTRRYVNGQVGTFEAETPRGRDELPFVYKSRLFAGDAYVVRSFGWAVKFDVSTGFEGNYRGFSLPPLRGHDPEAVEEFRRSKVPVTDYRTNPFFQVSTYTTDFMTILDFDTLSLQEDIRLGHVGVIRVYPVFKAMGSSRDYLGLATGVGYTWALGDGFAAFNVGWSQQARAPGDVADASVTATTQIATPRMPFGRLVLYSNGIFRYRNYQNRSSFLGGEGSLRGYPSNFFVGKDKLVYNLEFRTRPLSLSSLQMSGAVFHDAGDAFDGFSDFHVRHSWGFGVRALLPQISRLVMRVDVGFPLSRQGLEGVSPASFFVAFGQAFPPQPGAPQ